MMLLGMIIRISFLLCEGIKGTELYTQGIEPRSISDVKSPRRHHHQVPPTRRG